MWAGLIWLRIWYSSVVLWTRHEHLGSIKHWKFELSNLSRSILLYGDLACNRNKKQHWEIYSQIYIYIFAWAKWFVSCKTPNHINLGRPMYTPTRFQCTKHCIICMNKILLFPLCMKYFIMTNNGNNSYIHPTATRQLWITSGSEQKWEGFKP
jgi:hypothetical protein